jgi:endonuclease/exonuclease/phosphatase (EEP) superfamily protein YafD
MNRQRCNGIAWMCFALSAALLVLIVPVYLWRWDYVAALTLYPFWCWALAGALLAAFGHAVRRFRYVYVFYVAWALGAISFADGIAPVFRPFSPEQPRVANGFRVVSLNSAGTADAANEVMAFKPDIVLLQEVPGTNHVAMLARNLFGTNGSYVSGFDCAILTRYPMTPLPSRVPFFASAVLSNGTASVLVTSLRLVPPETRSDLFRPAAWIAYVENRRQRLRQLGDVLAFTRDYTGPQVIGGDFNAPGGDAVFKQMRDYQDAYAVAGRGWGHTALNNIPFVRPDQIWIRGLRPRSAGAVKTIHSDHRMVVVGVDFGP